MDPKLRALLKQGERATRLGKTQAAEDVYRQAVALFPDSADAWMGLSQVAPSEGERTACRRRAVELDPAVAVPSEAFATPSVRPAIGARSCHGDAIQPVGRRVGRLPESTSPGHSRHVGRQSQGALPQISPRG